MKIYIVTEGDYSAYRIVSVYTDKDKADEHVELLNRASKYAYAQVEEWETETAKKFIAYAVGYNFATERVNNRTRFRYEDGPVLTRLELHRVVDTLPETSVANYHKDYPDVYTGIAYGTSYEHAEKNLWDAIAKAKAEAAGL